MFSERLVVEKTHLCYPLKELFSCNRDAVLLGGCSLLKRWLMGTHQEAVSHKHLDYYLDEFTFRFNRRRSKSRGKLFFRLVQQAVAVEPVPLARILHPITGEVYSEVVVAGEGLAGAAQVATASWIEVREPASVIIPTKGRWPLGMEN